MSGSFSGYATYTNLLLSPQVGATSPFYRWNSRAQRGDVHSPRLHSEKELQFIARRDILLNHGPALLTVREEERAQSVLRLLGSAGKRGDQGRPLPRVLLKTYNGWPERLTVPLPRCVQAGPLVHKVPR